MGEIVRLGREHQDAIYAFLASSPIENVMMIDRLLEDGLPGKPYQEFVGFRERDRWLGVIYFSGDISIYVTEERAVPPLATYALERNPLVPRIISRKEVVDLFWETYRELRMPVLFDRRQLVYTLQPEDLVVAPEPALRLARPSEAREVAKLASAMSYEENRLDPFKDYPTSYLRLIEQRIRLERYYVLEIDNEIRFQVHLNSLTPHAGQVTGVYTPPQHRCKGYAARGMAAFCYHALFRAPELCLFVNDFNQSAISLYEKVGFKPTLEYRAIFLDAPN